MFTITEGKGFHLTFSNGYTISVQWGAANYCSNRSLDGVFGIPNDLVKTGEYSCQEAEIAIWDSEKNYCIDKFPLDGLHHDGMVAGWLSVDKVGQIIGIVASHKD